MNDRTPQPNRWIPDCDIPHLRQDFARHPATEMQHKVISMAEQEKLTPELKPPEHMRGDIDREHFDRRWLKLSRDIAIAQAAASEPKSERVQDHDEPSHHYSR